MTKRTFFAHLFLTCTLIGGTALRGADDHSTKLSGVVSYYKPGERIAIDLRPQVEKTYDLSDKDSTYAVDPGVKVGSKVEMEESKDSSGKQIVTIRLNR